MINYTFVRLCPRFSIELAVVIIETSCPCHVHDPGVDMDTGVHLVRDHVHLTLIVRLNDDVFDFEIQPICFFIHFGRKTYKGEF